MFKNALIYTGGLGLNKIIPFLLLPLLTIYINPADYGKIAIVNITISVVTVLISINFNGAILRSHFELNRVKQNQLFISAIKFTFFNSAILLLLMSTVIFVLKTFFGLTNIYEISTYWGFFAVFISLANALFALLLVYFQVRLKPYLHISVIILNTFTTAVISIIFVIVFKWGWEGRLLGIGVSSSIIILSMALWWKKDSQPSVQAIENKYFTSKLYGFGLPLIPHALSGVALVGIDRLFLSHFSDLKTVGIYSVAYQFGIIISIIVSAINTSWAPIFFLRITNNEHQYVLKKTVSIFIIIIILFFTLNISTKWMIKTFLDKNYLDAVNFISLITLGYMFEGFYIILSNYIIFFNKNIVLSYLTIIGLVVNTILNIVLIPARGAQGAAEATLVTYIIYFLIVFSYIVGYYKKRV